MRTRVAALLVLAAAVATPPYTATVPVGSVSIGAEPVANRAPLQPAAFHLLPLTAVRPRGWLRRQLEIQAAGLGGHVDEFWPDLGASSALAIDPGGVGDAVTVQEKPIGRIPFATDAAPIALSGRGRRVPAWEMVDGSAAAPPSSSVRTEAPLERLTLIPYGAAKLRITAFPVAAPQ
jgi:hypothetical protein